MTTSFRYTNPYSSTPKLSSTQSSLEEAVQGLLSNDVETWKKLHGVLLASPEVRSVHLARDIVQAAVQCIQNSSKVSEVFDVMFQCFHSWSDSLIYASVLDEPDVEERSAQPELLSVFEEVIARDSSQEQTKNQALSLISLCWDALSRFDQSTTIAMEIIESGASERTLSSAWWLSRHSSYTAIADFCMNILQSSQSGSESSLHGGKGKEALASIAVLTHLIQRGYNSWWFKLSREKQTALKEFLATHIQRLNDTEMPESTFSHLALASLLLNVVLVNNGSSFADYQSFSSSFNLPSLLLKCIFKNGDENTLPRWFQSESSVTKNRVLEILVGLKTSGTQLPISQESLHQYWSSLFASGGSFEASEKLTTAYRLSPAETHNALVTICDRLKGEMVGHKDIISRLWENARESTSIHPSILLACVFQRCSHAKDAFSQSLFSAIDSRFCHRVQEHILCLRTNELQQAKVLVLLEPILCMLELPSVPQGVLECMSVASVESLMQMMSPTQQCMPSKPDVEEVMGYVGDSQESTPNANNLSRIETSMCAIQTAVVARGIDDRIRMVSATVAARLRVNQGSPRSSSQLLMLQKRLDEGIGCYLSDSNLLSQTLGPSSVLLWRQKLRLIISLGSNYQSLLSKVLFDSETRREDEHMRQNAKFEQCRRELSYYRETATSLEKERESFMKKHSSEIHKLNRKSNRLESHFQAELKLAERIQNAELEAAKQCSEGYKRQVDALENQIDESKRRLETAEAARGRSERAMAEAMNEISSLTENMEKHQARTETAEKECAVLRVELNTKADSLRVASSCISEMKSELHSRQNSLERTEESEQHLRESIENLFGDMVSLSEMYTKVEKEAENGKTMVETGQKKLRREMDSLRRKNAVLENKSAQISAENEMLSKKYARAKDKLRVERQRSMNEESSTQQTAKHSFSYINQLHQLNQSKGSHRRSNKENESSSSLRPRNKARR